MISKQEITYWYTWAMLLKPLTTRRKNIIFSRCATHEPNISIIELFEKEELWEELNLSIDEQNCLREGKANLKNNAIIVEDLLNQGYDIVCIPREDIYYPQVLKRRLREESPIVLFCRGNKDLLNVRCIAIVGSRDAEEGGKAQEFTKNIVTKEVAESRVIVSGGAKGVDQWALNQTIEADGYSIMFIAQGITTFNSGFKHFYKSLSNGKLLIVSTFPPKAPWNQGFAMARNTYIYGIAEEIYVAQSNTSGGTWEGALNGIKRDLPVCVRYPDISEKKREGNIGLIKKGALAVDIKGDSLEVPKCCFSTTIDTQQSLF